jgi:hypothetical protein
MQEQWKPIKNYEGLYEVSNLGRIKSLERTYIGKGGKTYPIHEKILKPANHKEGYCFVYLCKDTKKQFCYIHRLVAETFIQNIENKPCVNHIDCDPSNNCVDNLEWCTQQENIQYSSKLGRQKGSNHTPIIATNLQTGEELYFESQNEAERQLNILHSNINSVLKGRYKQTGGYIFKYAEDPN